MISSFYSNPKQLKLPRKIKKKANATSPTNLPNGIMTNSIVPISGNTGNVTLYTNNQYRYLNLGGTKGTTHNGPITLSSTSIPSNMYQFGYNLGGYPNNTVPSTGPANISSLESTGYLINAVPSTPYSITTFTPGCYIVCINGSVEMSGTDSKVGKIEAGIIITSSSIVSTTSSIINYIGTSILNVDAEFDSTPKIIAISCCKVIYISTSVYSSVPSTSYISAAISFNALGDYTSTSDTISITIDSFSITRIG